MPKIIESPDSLVVTHATSDRPASGFSAAEWTGIPILLQSRCLYVNNDSGAKRGIKGMQYMNMLTSSTSARKKGGMALLRLFHLCTHIVMYKVPRRMILRGGYSS
ncbi:hypothetical protein PAAG_12437 [Paracoccidioides lutzii Pb01]|uniref:Uncharacterized protein n=1 Tax=Paracoccidioides lutzii (strain ATCC MYA-826 / Pb01) TaxID=502779 RepID=A0A0A2VJ02_PARBA|nr:hypothetical protein PAAG_12437 [Paracoccidioides lutzii Pb01]KGQ00894.1 hypothetical protein PAAG_12437 [Paracoccidioides lutzii Pb01]